MYKKRLFLLALLPPLFFTGCWDKRDPEDRAFIMTLGVDKKEGGYVFSFAPAGTGEGDPRIFTAEAATLAAAVAQVDVQTSRKTDLGQMKTVILGADVLSDSRKLEMFLQEMERSHAVSKKVMLLATDGQAADCAAAVLAADQKTGLFLWDFYRSTAGEVAVTEGIDLDTFLTEWTEQQGRGVLPRISVQEQKLQLGGGMAIATEGVYQLNAAEERGYLFLQGDAEGALLEGQYAGETVPLQIGKTDVRYAFSPHGEEIFCRIVMPMEGALQGGTGSFLSAQQQQEMETIFEGVIKEEVLHTLKIAQQAEEDLFGILPRLRQKCPDLTEGQEDNTLWQKFVFIIEPDLEIKDVGRKR